MQKYKQLDLQGRFQIKALLLAGTSQSKIAQIIGVHKSTISRELCRNIAKRGRGAKIYRPDLAQKKTKQRHHNKPKHIRFTTILKDQATYWLKEERLSPELSSARWRLRGVPGVSHETIFSGYGRQRSTMIRPSKGFITILNMVADNAR
jgi:IS30 family transposase